MKIIILIGGRHGTGKDTIGKYICNKYDFKRLAFADKLKDDVSKIYNINRKLFDIQEYKNNYLHGDKTIRDLLIEYSFKQKENDINVYSKKIVNDIKTNNYNKIVITDFRFEHEYLYIKDQLKDYNVYTLQIKRKCIENKYTNDKSETALEKFKFLYNINNTGNMDSLYKQVDYFYNIINSDIEILN